MEQITETSVYYWAESARGRTVLADSAYKTPEEVRAAIDKMNDRIKAENSAGWNRYYRSAVRGSIIRRETTTTRDENKRLISQSIVNTATGEIYPEKLPF